jgi:hypothetical protein
MKKLTAETRLHELDDSDLGGRGRHMRLLGVTGFMEAMPMTLGELAKIQKETEPLGRPS